MTSLCMGTRCYNFDSGFKFIETLSMVLRIVCVRYEIRIPSHPLYREIKILFCICRKKKNTPQIWTNACLAQHKESEHHQTASVFYRFQAQNIRTQDKISFTSCIQPMPRGYHKNKSNASSQPSSCPIKVPCEIASDRCGF